MGAVLTSIGVAFLALVVLVGRKVIDAEHSYWSDVVARGLIRLAARIEPQRWRATRRAEWTSELAALRKRHGYSPVLYGLYLPLGAARDRARQAIAGFAARPQTRLLLAATFTSVLTGAVASGFTTVAVRLAWGKEAAMWAAPVTSAVVTLFGLLVLRRFIRRMPSNQER
jgi:hypothetical protein